MEELRSTEVLVREILEDARKKAHKILKTTDDTLAAQKRDWENKTSSALESARNLYAERTAQTGGEILARLPLDKKRARSEATESLLVKAMDDFLTGLGRESLIAILERELSQRLSVWIADDAVKNGKPERASGVKARFSGMDISEAKDVLKKAAGDFFSAEWNIMEDSETRQYPCIVIDAQSVKITASVENAAAELLKEKRAELAAALLGGEVLND